MTRPFGPGCVSTFAQRMRALTGPGADPSRLLAAIQLLRVRGLADVADLLLALDGAGMLVREHEMVSRLLEQTRCDHGYLDRNRKLVRVCSRPHATMGVRGLHYCAEHDPGACIVPWAEPLADLDELHRHEGGDDCPRSPPRHLIR